MSFSFKPLTEEEIQSVNLMPEGQYQAEVLKVTEKISKSGNPMRELQLKVWDMQGREHIVFDYLVNQINCLYKVKHYCESSGRNDEYESGTLTDVDKWVGDMVQVEITKQKGQAKIGGGFYSDKNVIKDYIPSNKVKELNKVLKPKNDDEIPVFNDDVPF